jgi:DNA-directed RNA polymerase sigma subunit (sigma70/sigma32)
MPRTRADEKKSRRSAHSRARTTRSRRTQRTLVKPATAEQIIRSLGLTAEELRTVDRIVAQIPSLSKTAGRTKRR